MTRQIKQQISCGWHGLRQRDQPIMTPQRAMNKQTPLAFALLCDPNALPCEVAQQLQLSGQVHVEVV